MKKILASLLMLAGLAAAFVSCDPEEEVVEKEKPETPATWELTAPQAFADGAATLTLTASKAVKEDLTVALSLGEGTTLPEANITLPESISVAAGETVGSAQVTVDLADLKAGEYVVAINAVEGENNGSVSIKATKDLLTLASMYAIADGETVSGAVKWTVTYCARTGDKFVKDDTRSLYVYKYSASELKPGDVIEGVISAKMASFKGNKEITELDLSKATVTAGDAPEPTVLTLSELNSKFDDLAFELVKVEGVETAAALSANKTFTITQGEDSFDLFIQSNTELDVPANSVFDVTGIALYYNDNKQIKIWETAEVANIKTKTLQIKKAWEKLSAGENVWGSFMGIPKNADRNVAIDDKYIYIAEFNGNKKLWAIDVNNPDTYKALPTESVVSNATAGIVLSCPRIVKKTDGTPVLIVSNLGPGDAESGENIARLYVYKDGIDSEPAVVKLKNNGERIGDTFTVSGTFDKYMLLCNKFGGNGIVAFIMNAETEKSALKYRYNVSTESIGSFFPYPGSLSEGLFARRAEERAKHFKVTEKTDDVMWGDLWDAAVPVTLTDLDYANGTNGSCVGYNFVEFNGNRYVIYGRQPAPNGKDGILVVKSGAATDAWLTIANKSEVLFTDTISGAVASGNSAMDVAVWQGKDEVLIAVDKQNAGLALYKMGMALPE